MLFSSVVIAYTLQILSKVLGLFRDMLITKYLGASSLGDAYVLGAWLPTLLVNVGGMCLLPVVSSELAKLEGERWRHRLREWYWTILFSVSLPALTLYFAKDLTLSFAAPRLTGEIYLSASSVFSVYCLNSVGWLLNMVTTAALNGKRRYILPSLLSLHIPIGSCAGILLSEHLGGSLTAIALCSLAFTALAQYAAQRALSADGASFALLVPSRAIIAGLAATTLPYLISCTCVNFSIMALSRALNEHGAGNVTLYMIADRMWGVVGGLISLISLFLVPRIAAQSEQCSFPLRILTGAATLYAISLMFFTLAGPEVIPLLFARGDTTTTATASLLLLLLANALADFLVTTGYVLEHHLIAFGKGKSLAPGGIIFFLSALAILSIAPTQNVVQVVLLYGIAAFFRFGLLMVQVVRVTGAPRGLSAGTVARFVGATVAFYFLSRLTREALEAVPFSVRLTAGATLSIVLAIVYLVVAFGPTKVRELFTIFLGRGSKTSPVVSSLSVREAS